ncbi:MAG TPA: ATP-binding protein [Terriglobales bacterium]|jgi:predicted kinase|nr:ATP-binding protein [Terriglobales bacterium]
MSKWIRERMRRRRKKTDSKTSQGESLPPLQPDFLTSEERSRTPEPEAKQEQAEEAAPPVPAAAEPLAATEPASGRAEGQRAPGKRRRRRGRRGRGGRGPAAATQVTPLQPASPEPAQAAHLPEATPAAQPRKHAPPHPRHAAAVAQPRSPKGVVILAIGLPGSGKSTWFKRRDAVPLSSDVIRSMLFDDVTEQRFQDLVFSTLRSLLRARLVARMPLNYVDATNLSPHDRRGWIKMAHDFGYEVQAVYFDVPTEVCMERNARRNRVVPEEVMQRMAGKLRAPKFEEGFSKITVVRVKRADGEGAGDNPPESEGQEL